MNMNLLRRMGAMALAISIGAGAAVAWGADDAPKAPAPLVLGETVPAPSSNGHDSGIATPALPGDCVAMVIGWPDGTTDAGWSFVPYGQQRNFLVKQVQDPQNPLSVTIESKDGADFGFDAMLHLSLSADRGMIHVKWEVDGPKADFVRCVIANSHLNLLNKGHQVVATLSFKGMTGETTTPAVLEKTVATCNLTGLPAGGRGLRISPAAFSTASNWTATVEPSADKDHPHFRITMAHPVLGGLRLDASIRQGNVLNVMMLPQSDALPRLAKMARMADGLPDNSAQQAENLRIELNAVQSEINSHQQRVDRLQDDIRTVASMHTVHTETNEGGLVYNQTSISNYGQAQIRQDRDQIATEQQALPRLLAQQRQDQQQLAALLSDRGGPDLRSLPAAALDCMTPLVLNVEVPLTATQSAKLARVELALVERRSAPVHEAPPPPRPAEPVVRVDPKAPPVVHWAVEGYTQGSAYPTTPLPKLCTVRLQRETSLVTHYAGLAVGEKVASTQDAAYAAFKKSQGGQMDAASLDGSGGDWGTEKLGDTTYDTLSSVSGLTLTKVFVGVQDGRCVAYWFVGTRSSLAELKPAIGKASIKDATFIDPPPQPVYRPYNPGAPYNPYNPPNPYNNFNRNPNQP
jgi:hypothetical protein